MYSYSIQDKAWKRWFWCFLPLVSLLFTLTAHSAPVTRYIHTDPMGSPIAATDENGEILWVEDYKPYGERIRREEKSAPHKRWYTGHVQDDDTGLIYMGARYYDPEIGRFLSPDPVGFDAGNPVSFNKYAYANNNPYRYTDPDGRETNPVSRESGIHDSQLRTNKYNPDVGKQGYTRSSNNWNNGFHNGVDIRASVGTKLFAPISGVVRTISQRDNPKGGNVVFITRKDNGIMTMVGMAHLDSIAVNNGEIVGEGDLVGRAGTTGNASGMPKNEEHVHMSVRVNSVIVDPQEHFEKNPSRIDLR
ncbi:MAG: RHS repeat-associated core domain-containing protein [Pseudomonadota bacterium]